MGNMRVLDASGILRSGLDFSDSGYLITGGVRQEIRDIGERRFSIKEKAVDFPVENSIIAIDAAIERGLIRIKEPGENSIIKVKDVAKNSGDLERLSENDISVLALALETNSSIVSDDYNIQNVARILGLRYEKTFHSGIRKKLRWKRVCEGCGREGKGDICAVCGSKMRRVPTRISP